MEDRSWMYRRFVSGIKGITHEFIERVTKFTDYACGSELDTNLGKIRCPCTKCKNCRLEEAHVVREHLYRRGFIANYYNWSCHGEPFIRDSEMIWRKNIAEKGGARECGNETINTYRDMVFDAIGPNLQYEPATYNVEELPNSEARKFYDMLKAVETPLWSGCSTHSQLTVIARLLNNKSEHNMLEKCFNDILRIMKETMPSGSNIPNDFYNTKKLVAVLSLSVQKIDVCMNGCMLYWKDDSERRQCKFCGHDRYKRKKKVAKDSKKIEVPYKRMHYLPLSPRLQRLYASNVTAKHMRWHKESVGEDGVMCHPRDGEAWKHFDQSRPEFASKP